MTPREALKGKKVYIYARVSGEKQEGTLPDQLATIKEGLKDLGYKGQPVVFSEQASGTKNPLEDAKNRPELMALMKEALASEKPAVIVVRDIQRFSRDPYDLGELYNPLRRKDIAVISINEKLVLGTKSVEQPQADLVAPIYVSAGFTEVNTRKLQTKQGLKQSKGKGILQGSTVNLYRKDALEPRGELIRMLKADVSGRQIALRLSKSTSWVRKNKATLQKILLEGGDELLRDYLETINLIRDFMNEMDEDITGSRATKRMKTVVRMTSGYMNDPAAGFSKPTREDIDEYYNNFTKYKVREKR
jgi:DNA invertase Pin-like site-specific DNA recombinase